MKRVPSGTVLAASATALVIGVLAGVHFGSEHSAVTQDECSQKYPLTSQALDCADYEISSAQMDALQSKLFAAISLDIRQKHVKRASIWVRNLETKQYATVKALDAYAPASLLKLPLAIVYLKFAEIQPAVMTSNSVYTVPSELDERFNYFTGTTTLKVGQSYSSSDLLRRMIFASDNGAYFTLLHHVESDFYDRVMLDLGIQIPSDNGILDFVNVKTYATIFRTLYNASYLGREDSQALLDMMTNSEFRGLSTPLPADVKVAHKFGERSVYDQNGKSLSKELHDCGIVYKKPDPYVICIMTEGTDFDVLNTVIGDLSKVTYDNI